MATILYLRSALAPVSRGVNTNNKAGSAVGWRAQTLSTSVSTAANSTTTVTSVTGATSGIEPGSPVLEWLSAPLAAAATISGTVSLAICAHESNMSANATICVKLERLDKNLAVVSTIADTSFGTELGTQNARNSWTVTPTSTSMGEGERIRATVYFDDATGTTMASGYTLTMTYDGTSGNTGNSYIQFTEDLLVPGQEVILTASDAAAGDYYGISVALAGDGSKVVVGSQYNEKAYVYSGSSFGTETTLVASDNVTGDLFGYDVACSSDATVVVVGAWYADNGGTDRGKAYVYSGTNYGTETILAPSNLADNTRFGSCVACSGDGSTVFIGADNATVVRIYSGASYATLTTVTVSGISNSVGFGRALASSYDGSVLVVGADQRTVSGVQSGAVYVFSGASYGTTTTLTPSDASDGMNFGQSVACSTDGSVIVVGAYRDAVYVYSGTNWATEQKITPTVDASAFTEIFGWSVACSDDGRTIVVGSPNASGGGTTRGRVYVYSGPNYSVEQSFVASDGGDGDELGRGLSCSGTANLVAAGAPYADVGNSNNRGRAYVYRRSVTKDTAYLTATASDIADQGTVEQVAWTSRGNG